MIGIVFSSKNRVSFTSAKHMIGKYGFAQVESEFGNRWEGHGIAIQETNAEIVAVEEADSFGFDLIYFLSSHGSGKGISAFTVHAEGNWNDKAMLGGKPHELAVAAPMEMLALLKDMAASGYPEIRKTYEATHHGPFIKTPSLFVEFGGSEEHKNNVGMCQKLAELTFESIMKQRENPIMCSKVAIGVSGLHYPEKFSRLALESGYAFSHIMPAYAFKNEDGSDNAAMLLQAIERSNAKPESCVIEWKGLNAEGRNKIIAKLGDIGLDYERA